MTICLSAGLTIFLFENPELVVLSDQNRTFELLFITYGFFNIWALRGRLVHFACHVKAKFI